MLLRQALQESRGEFTQSLQRTASWVVKRKATQEIVFETFNPAVVQALNAERYEAVPILEHLQSLNRHSRTTAR